MSIVFSAITPHSPLLIPAIGKENLDKLAATVMALNKLEETLAAAAPESIVIVSPHGPIQTGSFLINMSPEFQVNFEEFGDYSLKSAFAGDVGLAHKIREQMETTAPVQMISEPKLDYGSSVPLVYLTRRLPKIKIIPIYYSGLDYEAHLHFGQLLKRELLVNRERIAIVASGDLSHKVSKLSPAGYSPQGKKFDTKLIELLLKNRVNEILEIKHDLIHNACECGLKSIIIMLGIISGMNCRAELLSYEAPFGVGHAVVNYKM